MEQSLHRQVATLAAFGARDVSQPRRDQHQRRVAVRECPNDTCPSSDLTDDPLERVVGADLPPVRAGVGVVSQRLRGPLLDELGRALELHRS